ncbi:putative ABC transport system permease protein [Pilibacter termitis]|uniref:Putative ABC transport system permease protein n=1 Tax=Pilibacter termitis TaxID=263852 RepID=A0A1T4MPP9_9ENTE|nr:ABC transporter permease [Pilibacter termitis]SJZ68708.1 putative ABC transport system permease protein [Pilibacter termitis]
MRFLNKKLRRDLSRNWTQFFSVFLMSCLSVLIFVGLQGAWHGLEVSLEKFITSSNLANSWVSSTGFTEKDMKNIQLIKGVEKVEAKRKLQVEQKSGQTLSLETFDFSITKPFIAKGEKFSSTITNGVWLNLEYARENDLSKGETIDVNFQGKDVDLEIIGFVQSADKIYYTGTAEFIAPNYRNYGYGYISENTMKTAFDYNGLPNVVEIVGENPKMREKLEQQLGSKMVSYFDRQTLVEVSDALDRVGQIRNLSYLFSFLFILLAILAMFTTIRRMIETQVKEIAILKALGFTNRKIGVHYTSFGLLVGGGGALVGAIFAPFMSSFVLSTQKEMFSLPSWQISYSISSFLLILFVIFICLVASYLASRKAISGLPALFLRGDITLRGKKVFLERFSVFWERLSFEHRWAIRDALMNKARMLMGIIGVAGGMMLLIAGIGMPESIHHLVDKAYHEDFRYTTRLQLNNYAEVKNAFPNGQWVEINQARFSPDDHFNRLLIVLGKGSYVNMRTENGKKVENGGIYVTKGFAERANLKVGENLNVFPYRKNGNYMFKIRGIITSETNQGAYLTQETWEKANGVFTPSTLLVGKDKRYLQTIKEEMILSTINMSSQEENARGFVESLMSIFMMIIGFAVLLVVVVLYNLGSLNFVERMRDYATLSVLGFRRGELRNITMLENLGTTFIGWLLGIPLGIWFLNEYVRTFSTPRLEYTSYVSGYNLLFSTLIVVIFSMSTTLLISRRIQKLDMVEALKGVE